MRDDFLDAQASVDWAVSQLDSLRDRIKRWFDDSPYVAFTEENLHTGNKVLQVVPSGAIPRLINAEAGAINSIRTSLALLATTLAQRHCKRLVKDAYFPICETDGRGHERIKRLSEADQMTIKNLQRCYGGNPLLLALNRLDNVRKHRRLLNFSQSAAGIGACRIGSIRRQQPPDDGYMLARSVADPNYNVQVRVQISFRQVPGLLGCPIELVMRKTPDIATSGISGAWCAHATTGTGRIVPRP